MPDQSRPSRRTGLLLANLIPNLAFLALATLPLFILDWERVSQAFSRAHPPSLGVLAAAPLLVQMHLVAVAGALALGVVLLAGRKGARTHRILGWAWAGLLAAAAISSVFLKGITGGFSFFHIITAITFVLLPLALVAARTHRVRWHAGLMVYLFVNILLGAGIIAFHPGFSERVLVRATFG
jgi:uncharacterized membrane protein